MNTFHMDIESVHACAQILNSRAEEIRRQTQTLMIAVRSMDWYGPSCDLFQFETERLIRQIIQVAEEGQILATHIHLEADQWQELDAMFVQKISQVIPCFSNGE